MSNLSKNTINQLKLLIKSNEERLTTLTNYYDLIINEDSRIINLDLHDEDYIELHQFFANKMDNLIIGTKQAKEILNKNE